jgi:hypothetical protein
MVQFFKVTTILFLLRLELCVFSLSRHHSLRRRELLHISNEEKVLSFMFVAGLLEAPQSAVAYERRDVGGADRSPTTAAFNEQAFLTNNRLEASGFKLDTREEEKTRLAEAMASFSYESASPVSKKKPGYGAPRKNVPKGSTQELGSNQ